MDKNDREVIELSDFLRRLPIFPKHVRSGNFRNVNSIMMKCGNFQYLDPEAPGGLPAGSNLDKEVWKEFRNDEKALRRTADRLRSMANLDEAAAEEIAEMDLQDESDDMEAAEGEAFYRLHRYRERNSALVRRKKSSVMEKVGKLSCEACGLDFEREYGEIGKGFIECHHSKRVADLLPGEKTKISDLILLCANCHRMIHRNGVMSLAELKKIIGR